MLRGVEPCPPTDFHDCDQKIIEIPERFLKPSHCFSVGNWSENGGHMQLIMDIDVETPERGILPLRVLVDTGAQVNLIRRELVPPESWRIAEDPVRLITANNTVLKGGDVVVDLGLFFEVVENGYAHPQPIFLKAEFYAAEIEVDAILSYPWLRENQMGVFPHHDALAIDQPTFALLYGWKKGRKRWGKKRRRKFIGKAIWPILAIPGGGGSIPPSRFGHEPGRWVACDYSVREPELKKILENFGVVPQRDVFVNKENSWFQKWWGPGSPDGEDAFEQNWGEGVLWMNPPFNVFDKVLDKILNDQAHTFLLVPKWFKRKFYQRAQNLAVDAIHFPKGAKLFERKGMPVGGIKWSVSVFLVCGHTPRCEKSEFHNEKGGDLESESTNCLVGEEEETPPSVGENRGILNPFEETPESVALFEVSKWGLRLPPRGRGVGSLSTLF